MSGLNDVPSPGHARKSSRYLSPRPKIARISRKDEFMRIPSAIAAALTASFALAVASSGAAQAHPHVWVKVETEVLFGPGHEIMGFRHQWTFDEMYTAFAVQGLDANGDGVYGREELQALAEVNVTALKEFGLFTYPKLGDKVLERKDATDYWLAYADGVLTLHMTVPLAEPVPAARMSAFSFAIYDPTFYVDLSYSGETPIRLAGAAPAGCAPKVAEPKVETARQVSLSEAFYQGLDARSDFGAQYARAVTIACGSK